MSKTTNRVLSMVLTVLMLVSMLTCFAMADAAPFAETYDGEVISRQALLVDSTITEADGETVTRAWDGTDYTFVVGENAFKSDVEVYAYIAEMLESEDEDVKAYFACPDIIVRSNNRVQWLFDSAANVYSPAWNTVPMNEMGDMTKVGAQGNGADWTANPEYPEKSLQMNAVIDGDVDGTVGIYGFTFEYQIHLNGLANWGSGVRTDATKSVDIVMVNTIVDSSVNNLDNIFDKYDNVSGQPLKDADNSLTIKNIYFRGIYTRLFYDGYFPKDVVLDGMYFDYDKCEKAGAGSNLNTYFKFAVTNPASMTIKNSNMRGTLTGYGSNPNSYFCVAGYKYAATPLDLSVTIENNTLTYKDGFGVGMVNYPDGVTNSMKPAMTSTAAGGVTSYKFNGNFVDASKNNMSALIYHNFPSADTVEFKGNKVVGFTGATQFSTENTVDASGNFVTSAKKATVQEYATVNGATLTKGSYFVDFDMTMSGAGITVSDVEVQGTESVEGNKITILLDGESDEKLTVDSFITGDAGEFDVTKSLSMTEDFAETIDEYDLATLNGVEVFYLKNAYDENHFIVYEVTVINTQIESFNDMLAADGGVTINGVTFTDWDTGVLLAPDVKVYEVGGESAAYAKFAGVTYKFVVDDWTVYKHPGTNNYDMSAISDYEGMNVILPAGNYGVVKPVSAAYYYGANFGINPNDKTGASAANNYNWALNEAWDEVNSTTFKWIDIPASITGEDLTFDGIKVSLIADDERTIDSEALYFTVKNSVIDALYDGATGNVNAAIFLGSPRANTIDEDAVASQDDSFTLENVYVKKMTANQFFDERVCANVTLDGVYLDGVAAGKGRPILGFFKTNSIGKTYITFKNSNFRNGSTRAGSNELFLVAGASTTANVYSVASLVEVVIDNNIVYNGQGTSAAMISPNISSVCKLDVTNNTFIEDAGLSMVFGKQNYGNVVVNDSPLKGKITIDGNTFVGFAAAKITNDFGFGDANPTMTNTYYSSTLEGLADATSTTGEHHAAMGSNDYYLDYGKTVMASDLVLVNAEAGTSDVEVSPVAQDTKSLIITLGESRTTEGVVMTVGDAAEGKWLDAEKAEITGAITEAGTYFYRVSSTTTPTVFVDYTVTVLGAPAEHFNAAYNLDNSGEVKNTALLVDTGIVETAGTVIERKWDDVYYKFTVGTNAFSSIDAAYAFIGDADLADAQIIVTNYTGSIVVKQKVNIYGLNWNTAPMNEMGDMTKVGANANGIDWTENEKYTENEINIENLIFAGGFECEEGETVKVAGFTVTGFISTDAYGLAGDLVRTPGETLNAEIVNFRANTAKFLFDHHYEALSAAGSGLRYLPENDSLIVRNMKYDMCGGRFWNGDGAVPSYLEIDGLYVDFSKLPLTANTFMKKAGAHSKTIIKNSNIRGTTPGKGNTGLICLAAWSGASYNYDPEYGYSYEVEVDNNTLTYETYNALLVEGSTTEYQGNYRQLYFEGGRFTGLSITNNYMDRKGNTAERIYASNPANVGSQLNQVNPEWTDNVITKFVGNRVVGYPLTEKFAKDELVEAYGNYFAAEYKEDGNYVGVPGSHPVKHTGGFTDSWFYYLDYDMTVPSNVLHDGYQIIDAGRNMIIAKDATVGDDGEIIYAYDDKVVNNEGTITVDFSHVIDGVHADDKATIHAVVTDGETETTIEADAETGTLELTADANGEAEFMLSVWSHDKTTNVTWVVKLQAPTHAWGDWTEISGATCESLAVEERVCDPDECMIDAECTERETREVGDFADHAYENYVHTDDATCESAGKLEGTCKWCEVEKDVIDDPEDPQKSHEGNFVEGQAKTCTDDGWLGHYECVNGCNKLYADEAFTVVIDDLDAWKVGDGKIAACHELDPVEGQGATCTEDGWNNYFQCSECEAFFADEDATTLIEDLDAWKAGEGKIAAGHDTEVVKGQAATCTVDGWNDHFKCTVCDELFADEAATKAIDDLDAWKVGDGKIAAGHTWSEWVYNNDATEEADGTETRTCTVCTTETETRTAVGTKLPPSVVIQDTSKVFKDVKKGWYKAAVDYCYSYGFIAGTSATEFGRDTQVTRGMFITILARIAGVDTSSAANKAATTKFTDVKAGKYYTAAIKWANENKIVSGTSDTTFGPENAISRQDLCVMILNYANFMNVELAEKEAEISFTDAAKIAKYARKAVKACQMADIVNGYANKTGFEFRPSNTATRAEAAQILFVFHSNFMAK